MSFFKSIRTKTALLFFLSFVVIVLPVHYIIYQKLARIIVDSDTREMRQEADKLLTQTRLDPPTIPLAPLGSRIKIQFNTDLVFQEIFTSPGFPETESEIFLQPQYEFDSLKWVTVSRPVDYSPGKIVLTLTRSNREVEEKLAGLRSWMFVANGAALFVAGILVFIVTGITLRPVQKIVSVAQRINASNSIERVPVPRSNDETRQLSETLNAMLARMESSIQDQTNFFASAAHELRTPLAIMQTELSMALAQAQDGETRKILESSLTEVQRLESVIHDFLLISQLKSDTLILRKKSAHPEELIYGALKKVKYLSQERGVTVRVNIEDTVLAVQVDFDKMETVLINLLENAIRYTTEKTVDVILRKQGEGFFIEVANTAAGESLRAEDLTHEFRKSAEYSTGLGMGLWICSRIVSMHGFNLMIEPSPGIFRVTIRT